MQVVVKRLLRNLGYSPDKQELATKMVLGQAKVARERWVA